MRSHKLWLERAIEDIESAKVLADRDLYGTASYHTQQCAEKTFKAFLAFKEQEIRRTHDLVFLVRLCSKIENSFIKLEEQAENLKQYNIRGRYPDDYIELDSDDIQELIRDAEDILSFVKQFIL